MAAGRGRPLLRGGGPVSREGPARGAGVPGPPRLSSQDTRSGPVFRSARIEDAPFLAELAGEAFGAYGDYRPVALAWAADPHVEVTMAEHDGAPVAAAFLLFLRPGEAPDTKVGDVLALAVAAPFRGRGFGRALLSHVVARARDVARRHGLAALRLTVAEGNTAARRLFESAGFRYDEREGTYPRGQRALHMSVALRGRRSGAG